MLTVGAARTMMEEKEKAAEAIANQKARYHALNGKVKFAKIVYKEMGMDIDIFM